MERLPSNPALEAFADSLREYTRGQDFRRAKPAGRGRVRRQPAAERGTR